MLTERSFRQHSIMECEPSPTGFEIQRYVDGEPTHWGNGGVIRKDRRDLRVTARHVLQPGFRWNSMDNLVTTEYDHPYHSLDGDDYRDVLVAETDEVGLPVADSWRVDELVRIRGFANGVPFDIPARTVVRMEVDFGFLNPTCAVGRVVHYQLLDSEPRFQGGMSGSLIYNSTGDKVLGIHTGSDLGDGFMPRLGIGENLAMAGESVDKNVLLMERVGTSPSFNYFRVSRTA